MTRERIQRIMKSLALLRGEDDGEREKEGKVRMLAAVRPE